MKPILFDSWISLGRTVVIGVLIYATLILFLRMSGKRTLSKMNAFDFVVTVALGSTLATALLSKQTSLADGAIALLLLVVLQLSVAWLAVRSKSFRKLIKSEPTLIFFRGHFMNAQMKQERVVRDEVLAAIRSEGFADVKQVEAVVLETDGTFSVISQPSHEPESSTLENGKS